MSTNVRIKQKSLFKKKLEMKDIVALTGLAYGVIDDNYRLIRNEMAENTLIYDENRLARGIDLWLDGTDILLSLSLPTTRSEIRLFYHVITTICNEVGTKKYIREEDTVSLKDNERFVQYDEEASIGALEDLQEKIGNGSLVHPSPGVAVKRFKYSKFSAILPVTSSIATVPIVFFSFLVTIITYVLVLR